MRIAHIICPLVDTDNSDLKLIHDITFESMKVAKELAKGVVEVDQFSAVFPEDELNQSLNFSKVIYLNHSSLDIDGFQFGMKLALIGETLDKLYENTNAEYLIYTDIRIALQPKFYLQIRKIIENGNDAFVVSNRLISKKYNSFDQFPLMLKARGKKQQEYDCFVYKRVHYKKFILGNSCIGHRWVSQLIIANLMAFADNFSYFENLNITFKLSGVGENWSNANVVEDNRLNEMELLIVLSHLLNNYLVNNRSELFKLYNEHLNSYYFSDTITPDQSMNYQINEDIAKLNSPVYTFKFDPDKVYHYNFRTDGDWLSYKDQFLRQDPVFIVGYPRSGTTLIQSLLATQQNTITLHETHFFSEIDRIIKIKNGKIVPELIDELIHNVRERVSLSVNAEHQIKKLVSGSGLSRKMLFEIIIIDNLLLHNKPDHILNKRWIEKTPDHALCIDDIAVLYPNAKFVFVVRHPEKAIISRKRHFVWNKESDWPIEKHIDRWLDSIKAAEYISYKYPGSLMFVKMEDVVKKPEIIINNICKFLNIPFNKSFLANYKNISRLTTYSWEKWKNDASGNISIDKVERKSDHLPILDRLVLNRELSKYLVKFEYSIEFDDLHSDSLTKSDFADCILKNYASGKQLMDLAKINRQIIDLDAKHAREKEKVISDLKVKYDRMIRSLQNKDHQIEQLQLNADKLNRDILKKKNNIQNLNNSIKERVHEKEKLAKILENRTIELRETKSAVKESDQKIKLLLKSDEGKKALIREQKKSIEVKGAKLSELLNSIENKNIEIKKLTKSIESNNTILNDIKLSIKTKDSELKSLDIKNKKTGKLNSDLNISIKKLEQKLTTKVIEIKKLEESTVKIEALIKKNKTEYNQELLGAKHEMQDQISDRETRIANLRNEKEKLNKDLLMKNELIDTIIASRSWKIGRIITKPVRLIKETIK